MAEAIPPRPPRRITTMYSAPLKVRIGELEVAVVSSGAMTRVEVTRPNRHGEEIAQTRMTGDESTKQAVKAFAAILAFIK